MGLHQTGWGSKTPSKKANLSACVWPGCKWHPLVYQGSAGVLGFCPWTESAGGAGWLWTGLLAPTAGPDISEHWCAAKRQNDKYLTDKLWFNLIKLNKFWHLTGVRTDNNQIDWYLTHFFFNPWPLTMEDLHLWLPSVCVSTWKWLSTDRKYSSSGRGPLKLFLKSLIPTLEKCWSNLWTSSFTTNHMSSKLSLWIR